MSFSAVLLLTAFSGCGGGTTLTPAQMQKVKEFDVSKIDVLGDAIHKGMNEDELIFYAPVNIVKAKEDYENALSAEQKDEKLAYYQAAKKDLKNAYETKILVKKYLSDVAEIDTKMQKQNTQEIFTNRYDDFKDDYNSLITTIDEGKVSEALADKKEVLANAKDLYGDAVVYRNINKAKMILNKIEDESWDEVVPKHFEKAQKIYEESRLRIKREPDNTELVERISKETNNAALYAQTLAKDVVKAKTMADEDSFEFYFDVLHKNIASLNVNESSEPILPLSMDEKVLYLKNNFSNVRSVKKAKKVEVKEETVKPVEAEEVVVNEEINATKAMPEQVQVNEEINTTKVIPVQEELPKNEKTLNAVEGEVVTPVETSSLEAVVAPVSLDAVQTPTEKTDKIVEEKVVSEEKQVQHEAAKEETTVVEEVATEKSVADANEEATVIDKNPVESVVEPK